MNLAGQAEASFETVKAAQQKIVTAVERKKEMDLEEEKIRQEAEEIKRKEEEEAQKAAEAAAAAAAEQERIRQEAEIRERQRTIIRKDGIYDSSSGKNDAAVLQPVLNAQPEKSRTGEEQTDTPSILRRR